MELLPSDYSLTLILVTDLPGFQVQYFFITLSAHGSGKEIDGLLEKACGPINCESAGAHSMQQQDYLLWPLHGRVRSSVARKMEGILETNKMPHNKRMQTDQMPATLAFGR